MQQATAAAVRGVGAEQPQVVIVLTSNQNSLLW